MLKEAVEKADLAVARGQDPAPRGDDRGLSRSSQARCDGRQRVQPDPHHPARQLRSRRRAGRAVRGDEALAGSDRAAAQEGGGRRVGRRQDRAARAGREPVPREVLQPGGGDQGLRGDPGARSGQQRGARLRQADVREAPRLGEADRGQPARDRQAQRRRRAQGPPHRGGEARLREDEEGRRSRSSFGRRCWRTTTRTSRRWASSRSSTSARRRGRAGRGAGAAGGRDRRRHAQVGDLREARASSSPRRCTTRRRRRRPGRRCWRMEPENRRAQDALKKLYLQSKDWDALEAFYASQNKWDELVRVLERQAETEDEARARQPVEQDRRALSRSPEQGGSRAEGVREGAVLRRRRTCRPRWR